MLIFNYTCLLCSIWTWNLINSTCSKKMKWQPRIDKFTITVRVKYFNLLIKLMQNILLKCYISNKEIRFLLQRDYPHLFRKIIHTCIKVELANRNYRSKSSQITMNFIKHTNTRTCRRRKRKFAKFPQLITITQFCRLWRACNINKLFILQILNWRSLRMSKVLVPNINSSKFKLIREMCFWNVKENIKIMLPFFCY